MTDMSNEHDLTEFKHAVKKLPKKMIMAYSNINKSESKDYKHLFDMAHYKMETNKLYMIYLDKERDVIIH